MTWISRFLPHPELATAGRSLIFRSLVLMSAVSLGCGDGPTAPGAPTPTGGLSRTSTPRPTPTASPTPPPAANLTGSWSGKFTGTVYTCNGGKSFTAAATAGFTQSGSSVDAVITAGCAFNHAGFHGTLVGSDLTLLRGTGSGSIQIKGSASSSHISANVGAFFLIDGKLTLDRRP